MLPRAVPIEKEDRIICSPFIGDGVLDWAALDLQPSLKLIGGIADTPHLKYIEDQKTRILSIIFSG